MNVKVIVLMLVCLVVGGVFGYACAFTQISQLEERYDELKKEYYALRADYDNLNSDHNLLKEKYSKLSLNYTSLKSSFQKLENEYYLLKNDFENLNLTYNKLKKDYEKLGNSLNELNITYTELKEDYKELKKEYEILKSAGIVFDGLKISGIKLEKGYIWYSVVGNVTNISDKPMRKVYVFLFEYEPDGSLGYYHTYTIENLAVNETNSFEFSTFLEEDQKFKVLAIGSFGYTDVENSEVVRLLARVAELQQMVSYELELLEDEEYYYSVIHDLRKANETVLVAMYSMVYDPDDPFDWANDLIEELVHAEERGVNVTVILEYRTYFDYMDKNLEAYNYLTMHGVKVILDEESDTDHMKLVIIDGKIVYIGSHNWSESALYYNHEVSVKIISEEMAQSLQEYLVHI